MLERLFGDPGFFLGHAATTLQTAAVGFRAGSGPIAIGIATLMAHSRLVERAILPIAIFVRVIPLIVWALMFVVWFGFRPDAQIPDRSADNFLPHHGQRADRAPFRETPARSTSFAP